MKYRHAAFFLLALLLLTPLLGSASAQPANQAATEPAKAKAAEARQAAKVPATEPVIDEAKLLPYLEQIMAWQREAAAIEATPGSARESLLRDALTQSSTKALTFSFQFARTQAEIIDRQSAATAPLDQDGDRARLQAAAGKVAGRIADLQSQVTATTDALHKATARQRPALKTHLSDLQSQIKFVAAQQDLLNNVLGVLGGLESSTNTGLVGKVNSLAESALPSDKTGSSGSSKTVTTTTTTATVDKNGVITTPSAGLLDVTGDLFKLWRELRDIESLSASATDLRKTNKEFLDALREGLRATIKEGTALSTAQAAIPAPAAPPATDAAPVHVETLDDVLATFKQLSTGIVPVTQTNIWLDSSVRTLTEWETTIRGEVETLARRLAIRLGVLSILILIPIAVSEIARRATNRYVRDDKRVKQLRAIRRTLLTIVILVIVVLSLVSEVGSIATFAGVITAGLAVAFQNVLLSLVAHFFFYGRYAVRAGDRVSVSGVIGDVVEVGAVRFYVRELVEDEAHKLEPTGRIAAFPNSILFQTTAFFKYV